jgi:hypothetical protein
MENLFKKMIRLRFTRFFKEKNQLRHFILAFFLNKIFPGHQIIEFGKFETLSPIYL